MRTASLVVAAFTLAVAPLTAQTWPSILRDIPILGGSQRDRGPVIVDRRDDDRYDDRYNNRDVVVREYNARNYGQWKKQFRKWRPVTLYGLGGRYYERPMRGARPITVYYYRDQYFFAPRDRDFARMRDDHRDGRYDDRGDDRRDDRRDDRYDDRRDNRRDDRYDDRDGRRDDRDNRPGGRTDGRYENRSRRPN